MKLTKIEPAWEYIPLSTGWTGEAYGNITGNRVTLRLTATRSDGASGIILLLPLHMRPGYRSSFTIDPTVGIGGSNRSAMWLSKGARALTMPSSTATGVEYQCEITYTI